MKTRRRLTLHEKAIQLCEGGIVEINGLCLRASTIKEGFNSCQDCCMGSACDEDISKLCAECDQYNHKNHILEIV